MSVQADFKGKDGHLFNRINWMYISTSDKGTHTNKKFGQGDDEVVIDYDVNNQPCGVWIRKPYEIEIFDEEGQYNEIMETDSSNGHAVIMMDTITLDDEMTMKLHRDNPVFNKVKQDGIKNGKTYHTGVNNE